MGCMIAYTISHAQEPIGCPQACPPCNVKVEWTEEGYQYEYTDNTVVITGTATTVYWQASNGHLVTRVCIKAGQQLYLIEPQGQERWAGSWETPRQDISHVVVCTETPTAIELASFHASTIGGLNIMLFLLGCVGMLLGLCIIAWAERRRRCLR